MTRPDAARIVLAILVVLLLAGALAAGADAAPRATTPQLIDGAHARGEIAAPRADLYRAYAIGRPAKLPRAYRSNSPWDGTLVLRDLHAALDRMEPGPVRREIASIIEPAAAAAGTCDTESSALPNETSTAHFLVQYDTVGAGLSIGAYTSSLETAWTKEVTTFGWAAPPQLAPGPKYHVRINDLGSGLYGFVSPNGTYAGLVGDNPSTAWNEGDAYGSCMVLNSDYTGFPSTPQDSLDSTTAHEFNHSIQFGYGALSGANAPDDVFVEGGATWMEDEVFDGADDNYNYLWPVFSDSMGAYGGSPYPYWIAFRGLTERYGTGIAGGGEDLMQDFWERTSRNLASNLTAMEQAVATEGTTLGEAFHAYAIAAKFNRTCGGGYVLPYCFEEAAGYLAAAGATPLNGTIATVGGSGGDRIEDNYTTQWIALPASGSPYSVTLRNNATAGGPGRLRGTAVCDTGSELSRSALPAVVADGTSQSATFNPAGCLSRVFVVTNETKTGDNPGTSTRRRYAVETAAISTTFPLTVAKSGTGSGTVTSSPAGISCGADCSQSYNDGTVVTLTAVASAGSQFTGWSGEGCSGTGTCQVTMSQARNVTAQFQPTFALTVAKSGTGSGTVTSSPAGVDCGADCSQAYLNGTVVTLGATPAAGSTFTGWSGEGCSGTGTCQVTMSQARSVTAGFQAITHTLTVNPSGTGGGTVTSSPAGISCGADCSQSYTQGTVVTLTAVASAGSQFTGWSGDCTGTGTCQVTMSAARNVTAEFQPVFTLTVARSGAGGGTVTSSPAGIDCGADCSQAYLDGTVVTLTAAAAAGSQFTGWTGEGCTGTGTCQVTMSAARGVTATFDLVPTVEPPPDDGVPDPAPPFVPIASQPPLEALTDTTPPAIVVASGPLRASRRGVVRLGVTCQEPATEVCSGVVRLAVRVPAATAAASRVVTIGRAGFDIAGGSGERVRIRLTRTGRRLLARSGRLRVRVVVVVADAAGNVRTVRETLTLRRHR